MATDTLPHASIIGAAVPRIDGPLKTTRNRALRSAITTFPNLAHAVAVQSHHRQGTHSHRSMLPLQRRCRACCWFCITAIWRASTAPFRTKRTAAWPRRGPRLTTTRSTTGASTSLRLWPRRWNRPAPRRKRSACEYDVEQAGCAPESRRRFHRRPRRAVGSAAIPIRRFPPRRSPSMKPMSTPVETHNPMEMHGTVAVWDGDNVTLYESSQGVVSHRTVMSEVLGVPRENVRVISRFVGSGFGGKLSPWPQATLAGSGCAPAEAACETQRRSAHDVFQRRPSPAHPAAHPPGRDAGWQAHRDPSRLSHPRRRSSTTSWSTAASRRHSSTAARISK